MNSISVYNNELVKKRGWISKIPDSKKAIMLLSGGFDSVITAIRLVKDYGMKLYPVYIDRGARNREAELAAVHKAIAYIRKQFGESQIHDLLILAVTIPPKEIKEQLQAYAKKNLYPMRNEIMHFLAVQYAATLGEDVRTICNGATMEDTAASIEMNRINTLAICERTKESNWNILSLNIDSQISKKLFFKQDEIIWAHKNKVPYEFTFTCVSPIKIDGSLYHCGQCFACKRKIEAFKIAKIEDKTEYKKGEK